MKPCSTCGCVKDESLFHLNQYVCKSCQKEYHRQHYQKNKEATLKQTAIYRLEHREERKKRAAVYREQNKQRRHEDKLRYNNAHREEVRISGKRWRLANKHKLNAQDAKRRALELEATPSWANHFFIEEIYRLAQLRTKIMGRRWEVDHIVPLVSKKVCGLHVECNLQVIPREMNVRKSNLDWPDMP